MNDVNTSYVFDVLNQELSQHGFFFCVSTYYYLYYLLQYFF